MTERLLTSTDGQPLGRRGLQTREQILDAIAKLIERNGLRGLKLADVADEVGFSPPAFYQYFRDLDEAILALCEEVSERLPGLTFPAEPSSNGATRESTRAFVERFMEYWDDNRAVLWTRNVAVNEGDTRFRAIRDQAFTPMVETLMSQVEAGKTIGAVDSAISSRSLATALVVMIDRIGMLSPHVIEPYDSADELERAVAYIFDRVLGIGAEGDDVRAASTGGGVRRPSRAPSGTKRSRAAR